MWRHMGKQSCGQWQQSTCCSGNTGSGLPHLSLLVFFHTSHCVYTLIYFSLSLFFAVIHTMKYRKYLVNFKDLYFKSAHMMHMESEVDDTVSLLRCFVFWKRIIIFLRIDWYFLRKDFFVLIKAIAKSFWALLTSFHDQSHQRYSLGLGI